MKLEPQTSGDTQKHKLTFFFFDNPKAQNEFTLLYIGSGIKEQKKCITCYSILSVLHRFQRRLLHLPLFYRNKLQ